MGRCRLQCADVRVEKPKRAVARNHIGFVDLRSPGANGFHLPPFENKACLEGFFDEIIETRFLVLGDAHAANRRGS